MTFGVALLDDCLEHLPLLVAPQLGLRAPADRPAAGLRGAPGLEDAALRGAAERDALDARRRRRLALLGAHLSKKT